MASTGQPPEWPWARRKRYMRPCLAMNGTTVYNTSFMNICDDARRCAYKRPDHGDLISMGASNDGLSCYGASYEPTEAHVNIRRPDPSKPEDNLRTGVGDVSGATINKMSFPGWPGVAPPMSIAPPPSILAMRGPMARVTTTRHDYTAKGAEKPPIIVPEGEIKISCKPLEANTTAQMSFQEPDYSKFAPSQSYRPRQEYHPPEGAVTGDTVCRMSYKPVPLAPKEDYPWAAKKKYAPPDTSMEGQTVYNQSFMNICDDARRCAYKRPDHGDLISMGASNDGLSCYGASYEPTEAHVNIRRPDPSKPEDNLRTGVGDVSGATINKMSFPGWPGVAPPMSIAPPPSILAMRGPMARVTTTRHDYTAKGAEKPPIIVPEGEIKISCKPLEDKTTAGMSFVEPDLSRFERQKSYAPARRYNPSQAPFDSTTVARLSFTGEQPEGPLIIASRNRPPMPPLSEEERAKVCSPVPSPPCTPKPTSPGAAMQPWAPAPVVCPPRREFEICRPQQGAGIQGVPNVKDFYSK
ncbi:uncharacterized protein LOC117639578 isoform X2 [Thrips palmi]|uniref:Uncharacterized protein LOC117639578 isoform X2 n=1 Tax=Thrips palmi TaxID=161013 RepID=A0A6P8Y4D7_THRPL|nr:uncharacterized protein LOC117639578 isoform X2 [Thrips palmi]